MSGLAVPRIGKAELALLRGIREEADADPVAAQVRPPEPARLLIAQCGADKLDRRAPALELYRGPLWQSVRAHAPGRAQVAVLSAKHGLVLADEPLDPYDRRLDKRRAAELAGLGVWDGAELVRARGNGQALAWGLDGRRTGPSAGQAFRRAADRAGAPIRGVCIVGGALYAGVAGAMVGKAIAAGLLPADCAVDTVTDEIGRMRQRMNRWLLEQGA